MAASDCVGALMAKSYLTFENAGTSPSGKTERVTVLTIGRHTLGRISWWAKWRRYALVPEDGTVWDAACLREVAAELDRMMAKRKKDQSLS